jgi:TRAP-type C4-dicarboxylate transport system permease small subunit
MLSVRRALDRVYAGAGFLAGTCIALIAVIVLAQIVGRWFGVIVPSTEDFSSYLLVSASFLALSYTFRSGGHIRVTLLINLLSSNCQQRLVHFTLAVFVIIATYGAYFLGFLVYESWYFHEVSQGYVVVPLWIPQLPMALGSMLLVIALLDDLVQSLRGKTPAFIRLEE